MIRWTVPKCIAKFLLSFPILTFPIIDILKHLVLLTILAKLHNNTIPAKTMPLPFCDFDSFFFVFCHPATQTYLCHELKSIEYMSVTLNTQLEELMFSSQIIYTWRRLRHQSKLYGVRLAQVFPTSTSPTCAVSLNIGGRTIWACAPRRSRWSNGWPRNTSRPSRCRCSVARSCPRSRIFPSPRPTIPVSSSSCGRSLSSPCRATRCPFSCCVTSLT